MACDRIRPEDGGRLLYCNVVIPIPGYAVLTDHLISPL
jgi:hypothetical protein